MEPKLLTTLDQIVPGRTLIQSDYAGDGYWKTCKFVILGAEGSAMSFNGGCPDEFDESKKILRRCFPVHESFFEHVCGNMWKSTGHYAHFVSSRGVQFDMNEIFVVVKSTRSCLLRYDGSITVL